MDRYLYDEDDGITHPHLRVESATDALAVMFLVDCGVLPPLVTDGPLPLDRARHLGHGNVLVFLDETRSSLLLVCIVQSLATHSAEVRAVPEHTRWAAMATSDKASSMCEQALEPWLYSNNLQL